jgi:hypothetical protein
MVELNSLYKNVMEFDLKLRNDNTFDEKLYTDIYQQFETLFKQWETQDFIPKSAFISCVYMVDILAGGNRFWSDDIRTKVEDALIAMQELITNIDNHPPYPK